MAKENIDARALEVASELVGLVSATKIVNMNKAGIEGNTLPKAGKFASFRVSGKVVTEEKKEVDYRHVRMNVKDSKDSISLSALKIVALIGSGTPEFAIIKKKGDYEGKYFLKGKSVNAQFAQYSDMELIALLENSNFTAVETKVRSLPFKVGGYTKEDTEKVELDAKKVYTVTLID